MMRGHSEGVSETEVTMSNSNQTSAFQEALETVDQLMLEEKKMLFDIAYKRFIEERRMRLAEDIAGAREAYRRGDVRRGTVRDLLAECPE